MYPHPTQLSDFLQSAGYIGNAAFDRMELQKDQGSQNGLFNLLCKVGEALVRPDLHDIQHAPNTQLAETHFIVKWSNIFKNVCEICCLL